MKAPNQPAAWDYVKYPRGSKHGALDWLPTVNAFLVEKVTILHTRTDGSILVDLDGRRVIVRERSFLVVDENDDVCSCACCEEDLEED